MAVTNEGDFDLLRHMRLSSLKDDYQLTREEKQALEEQRRLVLDETQYVAHCLQDKVNRIREQFFIRGCVRKPRSYTRDASDKYGFFWFGQGKYEDDDESKEAKAVERSVVSPQQEEKLGGGALELKGVPDEERFKVWRPVKGPPLRGNHAGGTLLSPVDVHHRSVKREPPTTANVAPAMRKTKCALTPPWAEHYRLDTNAPQKGQYIHMMQQHELYKRGVLPRGVNGVDDILRTARITQDCAVSAHEWRVREDRQQVQRALKDALDEQLLEKRKLQLARYEDELAHIYGPTMRQILNNVFGKEPSTREQRRFSKALARSDEGEVALCRQDSALHQSSAGVVAAEDRARGSRLAWLAAWEDYKRHPGTPETGTIVTSVVGSDALASPVSSSSMHYCPSVQHVSERFRSNEGQECGVRYQYQDTLGRQRMENIVGLNKSKSL